MSVFDWMECIIMCLLPNSFCKSGTIRRYFKHDTISRNTLMKNIQKITIRIEGKISKLLQSKFAIIFDG